MSSCAASSLTALGDAPVMGIVHNGPTELQVENCVIRGFTSASIYALSSRLLSIQDTVIQGGDIALFLDASASTPRWSASAWLTTSGVSWWVWEPGPRSATR